MARMSDLDEGLRAALERLELPRFARTPFAKGPALARRRVAVVSTAGIHRRSDPRYLPLAADYRVIPGDVDPADIVMSHVSANFDRTGFQEDWNVVFPLERLREMAERGEIGSVGAFHYAFMGATDPAQMEPAAREVAQLLGRDAVDAVLLVPV